MAMEDDGEPEVLAEESSGEPVCWLSRVCPACGRLAEGRDPRTCSACGEALRR
jgi:hypothetical protein